MFDSPGSDGVGPNLVDGETYADLSTASSSVFTSVDLDVCGPVAPTDLVWFNGAQSAWQQFSDQGPVNGDGMTATVMSTTTPSLTQLKGSDQPVPRTGHAGAPERGARRLGLRHRHRAERQRGGIGTVVVVAADDSTALVAADGGSAFTQDGGASASPGNRGSVEVLSSTGAGWVPSAMIMPPAAGTSDDSTGDVGEALAVSADGRTALIAGTVSDQTAGTTTDAVFVMRESEGSGPRRRNSTPRREMRDTPMTVPTLRGLGVAASPSPPTGRWPWSTRRATGRWSSPTSVTPGPSRRTAGGTERRPDRSARRRVERGDVHRRPDDRHRG